MFVYFWPCWGFVACGLFSGFRERAGAPHCSGLLSGAQALGCAAFSVSVRGQQLQTRDLEHRLSSRGARASLLCSIWDLTGPEIKPVSPELAGGFFSHQGSPKFFLLKMNLIIFINVL